MAAIAVSYAVTVYCQQKGCKNISEVHRPIDLTADVTAYSHTEALIKAVHQFQQQGWTVTASDQGVEAICPQCWCTSCNAGPRGPNRILCPACHARGVAELEREAADHA